jgi:hypothetical protein
MRAIGRSAPFAFLLCAAGYLLLLTRQFEFPRAPGRLGPDVWPQAILALLMLACVVGIASKLLEGRRIDRSAEPQKQPSMLPGDAGADEPAGAPSRYELVAGGLLLFLAYPIGLQHLGFLLATFLLMALFMLVGRWRSALGVIGLSAVGTLGLFYVFRGIVYVSLPLGTGPFQSASLWVASLMGMR